MRMAVPAMVLTVALAGCGNGNGEPEVTRADFREAARSSPVLASRSDAQLDDAANQVCTDAERAGPVEAMAVHAAALRGLGVDEDAAVRVVAGAIAVYCPALAEESDRES